MTLLELDTSDKLEWDWRFWADGDMFYLLVYRGGYLSVVSSLFQIDTANGEIRELSDWPAADRELPFQDHEKIVVGGGGGRFCSTGRKF